MRVLCIDGSAPPGVSIPPEVKEGEVYTVQGETFSKRGIPCYIFSGFMFNYYKSRFVPTSDIDERDMKRDYLKEKVLK